MRKSRHRIWRATAFAASVGLLAGLAGCSDNAGKGASKVTAGGVTTDGNVVVVDTDVSEVELEVGNRLVIDLGSYNPSVGDDFEVAQEPDANILANFASESNYLGEEDEDGAPSSLQYTADAVAAGETEIKIDYYFRQEKSGERPDTHLTVRVVNP